MRLALVTGGRDFSPSDRSWSDARAALEGVMLVVEGEAVGFDLFMREAAERAGVIVQPVPALWAIAKAQGRSVGAEGPIRNMRMVRWGLGLAVDYGLEPILIAGPGGQGTADMRARCRMLPVIEVRP